MKRPGVPFFGRGGGGFANFSSPCFDGKLGVEKSPPLPAPFTPVYSAMEKTENAVNREPAASPRVHAPWFAFYDADVPRTGPFRELPLYHWLDEAARAHPGRIACSYYNTNITYARMQRAAETLAAGLHGHGLAPGDRVGIMLPNLPQTMIAFWGVLKAGGVVTMFNPLYMEKELIYQARDAGIRHMISIDSCWPKFSRLNGQMGVERYFITRADEGLSFPLNLMQRFKVLREKSGISVPYDGRQVFPFSALLTGKKRLSHPVDSPKETLACLQYTGGTTGRPKGAMLTHGNISSNIQQIGAFLSFLREDEQTFMAVLPFFHVYGMNTCLALPAFFHARVVPVTRFVPLELLASMKKFRATVLPGAPAMYISLLRQKHKGDFSLNSLKVCIAGSAPMPVEMIRQFEEAFGARIIEGYGLSEASPITHLTPARGLRKVGSIGLPLPGTEAQIVDMEVGAVPLAPGKVGELVVRGPQVMAGYWNNPDESAGTLRNGWLYTGDIASMDEDGYFTIVDRKKDMILVAGYNVSPREIDEVLYEHPKIRDAVCVGLSHPSRGEVIKAYVVLREGESCDRAEIVAWCRERLANYKVPRMVEFRTELPRTLVGKILRRALKAEEEEKRKDRGSGGAAPEDIDPDFDDDLPGETPDFAAKPPAANTDGSVCRDRAETSSPQDFAAGKRERKKTPGPDTKEHNHV